MLVGHFAVAFSAKRIAPAISLGTLVFAAMLADLLWCAFMIAGIEQVHYTPACGAANYFVATDIALSHSLAMGTLWAAILAAIFIVFLRRQIRATAIVFAVVFSHWFLDFVSHKPDMPLAPGIHTYLGLGLWNSIPATLLLEGSFWLCALIVYARSSKPRKRTAAYFYWLPAAVLTLLWYNNLAGPPPPDPHTAPAVALSLFLLTVLWAYWINAARPLKTAIKRQRP